MDFNVLFSDGYSEVADRILKFLPYDSIKTCCDVSPQWKNYSRECMDLIFKLLIKKPEDRISLEGSL